MVVQNLFSLALHNHFITCSHPHSKGDFRTQAFLPYPNSDINTLVIYGAKDGISTQESLFFSTDSVEAREPVIELICLTLEEMDKVLFPSLLMKILEEEIPY